MDEAISSHIGGWFRSAATTARIHPVGAARTTSTSCPSRRSRPSRSRPPSPCSRRWSCRTGRRSRCRARGRGPAELVDAEIERCGTRWPSWRLWRAGRRWTATSSSSTSSARPARPVATWWSSSAPAGWSTSSRTLTGMSPGETKDVEHEVVDGTTAQITVTLNEIKEKVLPPPTTTSRAPRASSTRSPSCARTSWPPAGADRGRDRRGLPRRDRRHSRPRVRRAAVRPTRRCARERAAGRFLRTLERRGISPETYLAASGQTPSSCATSFTRRLLSVARELVLDAVPTTSASRCPTRRSRRRSASRARPRRPCAR